MNCIQSALAALILALCVSCASGNDLTKVERRVVKEPVYQSKSPKYCLLVFGPDASTRIWLVLDGSSLFADLNGNGDLTDSGEKFQATELPKEQGGGRLFETSVLPNRGGIKPKTKLQILLVDDLTFVYALSEDKSWQRAVRDQTGDLHFADSAKEAPIVHFHGDLTLALRFEQSLTRGDKPTDLDIMIGTPGLGPGSFSRVSIDAIPQGCNPIATIKFQAGDNTSFSQDFVLEHRC